MLEVDSTLLNDRAMRRKAGRSCSVAHASISSSFVEVLEVERCFNPEPDSLKKPRKLRGFLCCKASVLSGMVISDVYYGFTAGSSGWCRLPASTITLVAL